MKPQSFLLCRAILALLLLFQFGCQPSDDASVLSAAHSEPQAAPDSLISFYDPNSGISFRYPSSYLLNYRQGIPDRPAIYISIERPGDLSGTLGYDSTTAFQERRALAQGEFGPKVDFPVEASKQVVALPGGHYAKTFAVMQRLEICDVTFQQVFITYLNGFQVRIMLSTPAQQVMQQNPSYFGQDKANCSDLTIWKENGPEAFYKDLQAGKISGAAADWHRKFLVLVSSVAVDENAVDVEQMDGIGFIRKVDTKGQKRYIEIDFINWYWGEGASRAVQQEEGPKVCQDLGPGCLPPGGFYMVNNEARYETLELSPNASFTFQTAQLDSTGSLKWNMPGTFGLFYTLINEGNQLENAGRQEFSGTIPFWIRREKGRVVQVAEQYIP